ncbi:DUF167 domain-containing protein [Sphingosinicella sp.]|uniref:DUF167 domain-containing protein n=1 Tax=Sphingosinicella sp. TaxID=1917971 RepID=UPI0035B4D052
METALAALVSLDGTLAVRVTPKARGGERILVEDTPEGPRARVWVSAPPEDGKANAAVCRLVAKALGLPKSAVSVARGDTSREKLLRIAR